MTYEAIEESVAGGSPIELYEFQRAGQVYRYTSQDADFELSGQTFEAVAIKRSSIESTTDASRVNLRVLLGRTVEVLEDLIQVPPASVMLVTVRRIHRGDAEAVVVWLGRVVNAEWRAGGDVELTCEPVFTSLRRNGLRRYYQRNCPHVLYDAHCRANPAAFRTFGTVSAIDGRTVTVLEASGLGAAVLNGGFASWTGTTGLPEQRMILGQSGADVELAAPPIGLVIGASILLHLGCDRTLATCNARFANSDNYGGFPFIPIRNPLDGNPIF